MICKNDKKKHRQRSLRIKTPIEAALWFYICVPGSISSACQDDRAVPGNSWDCLSYHDPTMLGPLACWMFPSPSPRRGACVMARRPDVVLIVFVPSQALPGQDLVPDQAGRGLDHAVLIQNPGRAVGGKAQHRGIWLGNHSTQCV